MIEFLPFPDDGVCSQDSDGIYLKEVGENAQVIMGFYPAMSLTCFVAPSWTWKC